MAGPLFAIIFAGLIIIVLLLIGEAFYKRFPKVCFTIWGFTVLLLFYFIYSFNTSNTRLGDKEINNYVGTYKIDVNNSLYDSTELQQYYDLQLIVKADKTFTFSYEAPFFEDTVGHWQPMSDGDISWTEISLGNGDFIQSQVEPDKWNFSGTLLTNSKYSNSIIFAR